MLTLPDRIPIGQFFDLKETKNKADRLLRSALFL